MKKLNFICVVLLLFVLNLSAHGKELRVLQFNIWQEGTVVNGGFDAIVDNIVSLKPDMVTFCEVRNYKDVKFIPRLVKALGEKGMKYYGKESVSTGIISLYPIEKQAVVSPLENDHGSVLKANIKVGSAEVALYAAHLDYLNYACFLPRGYDGSTFQQIAAPVTNIDSILADNRASYRDDEIRSFIEDAKKERAKGSIVILGGDFNEPSLLDWQKDTKDMRDHNGVVIDWDCSKLLLDNGYKDSYRVIYPNAVKHPGFTFPADNKDVELKKLVWASKVDERDRIDFIYYYPMKSLKLKGVSIVGPSGSISHGQRVADETGEHFIPSKGVWPTDHKALMTTFVIK